MNELSRFFYPDSVAVVGASEALTAYGTRYIQALLDFGFDGRRSMRSTTTATRCSATRYTGRFSTFRSMSISRASACRRGLSLMFCVIV